MSEDDRPRTMIVTLAVAAYGTVWPPDSDASVIGVAMGKHQEGARADLIAPRSPPTILCGASVPRNTLRAGSDGH